MRMIRSVLCGLLCAAVAGSSVAAAQEAGQLVQGPDGTIYVIQDEVKAPVDVSPVSQDDLDAVADMTVDVASITAVPTLPDPVALTLPKETTALLVLDMQTSNCGSRPACLTSLPRVKALLERARSSGVAVIYSDTGATAVILSEVAPLASEPRVRAQANKFFGTNLDGLLKERGITTVVMTGTSSNGAILYTAFEAVVRGYKVVIAEDGISASNTYIAAYTLYQLLNQPGGANPTNRPLAAGNTLSRGDLISFN